jgi:cell division protein FtsW
LRAFWSTILGEELGLAGTLMVLGLFTILAIAVFKVIARTQDTFARIVSSSVITWIIGQAVVNTAMVSGLLPVIGVPLPFIFYGLLPLASRRRPTSSSNHGCLSDDKHPHHTQSMAGDGRFVAA